MPREPKLELPLSTHLCLVSGENVREFFFRVAALTFEANVLAELEKSGARRIGDVVREFPPGGGWQKAGTLQSLLHLFPTLLQASTVMTATST